MKLIEFITLAVLITAPFALTGCKLSGGGSGSSGSSYGDSGSSSSSYSSSGLDGSSGGGGLLGAPSGGNFMNPEPATIALLGSGLLGYGLLKTRKKKKK